MIAGCLYEIAWNEMKIGYRKTDVLEILEDHRIQKIERKYLETRV